MSSREFSEWLMYERIDPGEPDRGDYQTAMLASVVANSIKQIFGRHGKLIPMEDFLLRFDDALVEEVPRKKSPAEIKAKLLIWKGMHEQRKK
jgi:hypothetical protein